MSTTHIYGSDLLGVGQPPAIPGYRLERRLGQGGFGAVWLATEAQTGRSVALKIAHTPEQSLAREIQCLKALAEPRTADLAVPAYIAEGRTEDGWAYLVEEYLEGKTLNIQEHRTPAEAEALLRRLAGMVAALHRLTRERLDHLHVHGDLKPGNLLLTPEGRLVLLDLGAARKVKNEGPTTGQVGAVSHGYGAPEVYAGRRPTPASDVYSLGVIGFEILTGTRWADPVIYHRQEQALAALDQACGDRKTLAQALRRTLTNEPEHRLATPEAFLAYLDNPVACALGLEGIPPVQPAEIQRAIRRHRALSMAETCLTVGCTLAVGWFAMPFVFWGLGKLGGPESLPHPRLSWVGMSMAVGGWLAFFFCTRAASVRRARGLIVLAGRALAGRDCAGAADCLKAARHGQSKEAGAQLGSLARVREAHGV